jgi:hypothetical protein
MVILTVAAVAAADDDLGAVRFVRSTASNDGRRSLEGGGNEKVLLFHKTNDLSDAITDDKSISLKQGCKDPKDLLVVESCMATGFG